MSSVESRRPQGTRPWAVFLSIALGGAALLFASLWAEASLKSIIWRIVAPSGEHLASALIVAGIMGLTYEWFVHSRTTKEFGELNEAQNRTFRAIIEKQNDFIGQTLINILAEVDKIRQTAQAISADEVFKQLIHDMAENRDRIPTLFAPPRDELGEFVFSTNHEFFERLVVNKGDRARVVDVLRDWLSPWRTPKFRFLASDFVGLLRLHELAPELRKYCDSKLPRWSAITEEQERSCLLNYAWAASRCETQPYRYLTYLLLTMPSDAQEWILFVPRQMFDAELRAMIDDYLETKGSGLSADLLRSVITAIRSLHFEGQVDMSRVARKHRPIFDAVQLAPELDAAVGIVSSSRESLPIPSSA